jgi:CBS domain-containing protein
MALLISSPSADIMATRAAVELRARLQLQLGNRLARLQSDEQIALLRACHERLNGELAVEEELMAAAAALDDSLARASLPEELAAPCSAVAGLALDHFQRRRSVCAVQAICSTFRDRLIHKALDLAGEILDSTSAARPPARYAVLTSGSGGRREQTLSGGGNFFLIYDGSGKLCDEYFGKLRAQLLAVLRQAGLPFEPGPSWLDSPVWHGSIFAWQGLIEERLQPPAAPHWLSLPALPTLTASAPFFQPAAEEYGRMIELLADLRPVAGDPTFAATLKEFVRVRLSAEVGTDAFLYLAKRTAALPVARSVFGWFRVVRSGEHRGEFNLDQLALEPLLMTVRFLALRHEVSATGTCNRIKELCATGRLGIELSDRLLTAFQEFGRHKIDLEIRRGRDGGEFFFNPEELVDGERQRFRHGLEAVVSLQKLLYQELTEAG